MSLKSGLLSGSLGAEIHFFKMFQIPASAVVNRQVSPEPMSAQS